MFCKLKKKEKRIKYPIFMILVIKKTKIIASISGFILNVIFYNMKYLPLLFA
jgi:hypothetical protein